MFFSKCYNCYRYVLYHRFRVSMHQNDTAKLSAKPATGKEDSSGKAVNETSSIPGISLPKGGGAIKSIDDKFSVNALNGTATFSIPFPFSPSRNAFMPSMSLSYNSGSGNGLFGLGWSAEPLSISRKTEKKLPQYNNEDTFIFSGLEDLVPAFKKDSLGNWLKDESADGSIVRYKPRIEGSFSRIEKLTETNGNVYWKATAKDNTVSIFGKSKSAQLSDPADQSKIFRWFLEFSYDDKGNCFQYQYINENKINVQTALHEKNRLNDLSRPVNIYLKKIKYCNQHHFYRTTIDLDNWDIFLNSINYLLELVLDYGDHAQLNPDPDENHGWSCRPDPFSVYLPGFELRTWRLCRRLLMFHHFAELGNRPCLVRSLELNYDSTKWFSFLTSVTQKGFIKKPDGSYSEKSFPPIEFSYEKPGWETAVKELPKESLQNLPIGIDDHEYQWIDLFNEGLSGILTEQAGGWYYKRNSGDGNFDPVKLVSSKPSVTGLNSGKLQFRDLEANGEKQLVNIELSGYYDINDENEWEPFRPFEDAVNIAMEDPNIKFIDLTGDGKPDILLSGENIFTWYPSKGKKGFGHSQTALRTFEEEKGPVLMFADDTQSVLLADMNGDGLMDIVRIRNNEIAYWPNLGYAKFGAKVCMSNAPLFDNTGEFNPQNIRLADLDGSGVPDIVYLGKDSFKIYFNQSGNSWSDQNIVQGINPIPFPKIDSQSKINVLDLLGNGTGCIVWSSAMPQHAATPIRYIDIMGGKKPYVMNACKNNRGKEVIIHYMPSTYYYLKDRKNNTPWVTRLPFPVQCVSKVETFDRVRKTRFVNEYSYHHGYYDHGEGEFRGFGRVDQTDTEDFENYKKNSGPGGLQLTDERFYSPPALTKTWFHTGAYSSQEKILDQFAHEYFQNEVVSENALPQPQLNQEWTTAECREALRACKGLVLHTEIYSLDGSAKEKLPYTTAHHHALIQLHQPLLNNQHAVFTVLESEALAYNYERNAGDPRITHTMVIEADEFGNILKTATIGYGRKTIDPDLDDSERSEQNRTYIVFTENNYTNKIDSPSDYHLPVLWETKTFELTGLTPESNYFRPGKMKSDFESAALIAYQDISSPGITQKRLIEHLRYVYFKNDLSGPLPAGELQSLALPYESYQLALTPSLADHLFGNKVNESLLLNQGKYYKATDGNYWTVSGTLTLDRDNFYQLMEMTDPFGYNTRFYFDPAYHYFLNKTTDQLDNSFEVLLFNFRTLSPVLMKDINDNRTGVRIDELGMVSALFAMGKENENRGDVFDTNAVESSTNDQPGSVLLYDLFQYSHYNKPNFLKTITNETHYFQSIETGKPIVRQEAYIYYCGGGNEVMKKLQAEPGKALQENPDGSVTEVDTTPNLRWIGNGRTIFNNKGKPVKQYEPYFSTSFEYEESNLLVERGVTPIAWYDPMGRVVKTDMPDSTFSKMEPGSWKQKTFDVNDTVLNSKWYEERINNLIDSVLTNEGKDPAREKEAAQKAAAHADTPAIVYFDPLGRNFLSIADNGSRGQYKTHLQTDIKGNLKKMIDARGNAVIQYKYDMLGNPCYSLSMDAGERWTINDVMGKVLMTWDSRDHIFRYEYDELHRPKNTFVSIQSAAEINCEKIVYGENIADDKKQNLRGKKYQLFDAAGCVTNAAFDFKGNLLVSSRQLCKDYQSDNNWNGQPDMDSELFSTETAYDALNRPENIRAPDGSIITPKYNEAGLPDKLEVQLKGSNATIPFIKKINYNEKGQRESLVYGNDCKTMYRYDKKNFRLTGLTTLRKNETDFIQQWQYTYDPAGNITHIKDEAQQTFFFSNAIVEPSCDYEYDAIYQLIKAKGREHIGQNQLAADNWNDDNFRNLVHKGQGNAMRSYIQEFLYDEAGNIMQLKHSAGNGSYTRAYEYENTNNRLKHTKINSDLFLYHHDLHGNINQLPHLSLMEWDFKDQLRSTQQTVGNGERTFYVYDGSGQRVRKVIRQQGSVLKKEERIYLGGFEIFRSYKNDGITVELERRTLHIMDGKKRFALVETKNIDNGSNDPTPRDQPMIRYQLGNHLGSSSLELNEKGEIVSYEEYHPYGTTSYQAMDKNINSVAKRYRFTAMERDEESGFAYHSARYYLPWLGRWLNADPISIEGGENLYQYCKNNVLINTDILGLEPSIPPNDKELGNIADKYVSKAMAAEIELENPGTVTKTQVYTKQGGTKKNMDPFFNLKSKGKIDLLAIDKNATAELWEIKPDTPANIELAKKEALFYQKNAPDSVDGIPLKRVVLGKKLKPISVEFSIGNYIVSASTRSPAEGVIVYQWGIEKKQTQESPAYEPAPLLVPDQGLSRISASDWDNVANSKPLSPEGRLIYPALDDIGIKAEVDKAQEAIHQNVVLMRRGLARAESAERLAKLTADMGCMGQCTFQMDYDFSRLRGGKIAAGVTLVALGVRYIAIKLAEAGIIAFLFATS